MKTIIILLYSYTVTPTCSINVMNLLQRWPFPRTSFCQLGAYSLYVFPGNFDTRTTFEEQSNHWKWCERLVSSFHSTFCWSINILQFKTLNWDFKQLTLSDRSREITVSSMIKLKYSFEGSFCKWTRKIYFFKSNK